MSKVVQIQSGLEGADVNGPLDLKLPQHVKGKKKRQNIFAKTLVGDYQCDKNMLNRATEALFFTMMVKPWDYALNIQKTNQMHDFERVHQVSSRIFFISVKIH